MIGVKFFDSKSMSIGVKGFDVATMGIGVKWFDEVATMGAGVKKFDVVGIEDNNQGENREALFPSLCRACLKKLCVFERAEQHQVEATSSAGDDTKYWTAVAPEVESISSRVARQIGSTSTVVADSIMMGGDWAASGIKQGGALLKRKGPDTPVSDGGVSPRMMKRMQQARRMSAVAKVMSRTLLKGTISATGHVSRTLGLDVNTPSDETSMRNVAVASVDAFGKVVEAVETAGKSLYGVTRSVGTDIAQERFGSHAGQVLQDGLSSVGNVINTAWTLNKMGVKMLLRVAAASTALNLRSGSAQVTPINLQPTNSSLVSSVTSSPPLQHQITLSPQQHLESLHDAAVPLNLLPPANYGHDHHHHNPQPLQTSQLFPTTAGQLRASNSPVGLPAASLFNPFTPAGNYTTSIPPGPRPNSPFQQYHRATPQESHQPPFSFPYDDKN